MRVTVCKLFRSNCWGPSKTVKVEYVSYMYIGTVIGALIGFFTLGPPGALFGGVAGHFFDKGRMKVAASFTEPTDANQVVEPVALPTPSTLACYQIE